MVTAALGQVGVQAVVQGLKAFKSGMNEMNSSVDSFGAKIKNLAQKPFKILGNVIGGLFDSLKRIGEFFTAGILLRGFDAITNAVKTLAGEVLNAGMEFQLLKIRLENFLATDLMATGSVDNLQDALKMAVGPAQELFDWILKLAMTTPFDAQDVADTFTMAKAWGFATDEAKKLVIQVSDFAAGMGFGALEMDRVIKALGQMKSLGRVAGQELLQLANAGVPVADIMENIRIELGLTTEEFMTLRRKGGVSAEMFFEQWDRLMKERFEGSAIRASRTIKGVLGNIKDLITGIFGMKVVVPVLDVISERMEGFLNALTTGENFDRLLEITKGLGEALVSITELFLGELPDPAAFAEKFLDMLENFKNVMIGIKPIIDEMLQGNVTPGQGISAILQLLGINENTAGMIGTFADKLGEMWEKVKEIYASFRDEGFMAGLESIGLPEPIMNFIKSLETAWGNLTTFWDEHGEDLKKTLKDIFASIFEAIGIGEVDTEKTTLIEMVGKLIENLSQRLVDNGDTIVDDLERIGTTIREDFLPAFYEVTDWITENDHIVWGFINAFVIGTANLYVVSKLWSGIAAFFGVALIVIVGWAVWARDRLIGFIEWMFSAFGYSRWWSLGQIFMAGFRDGIISGVLSLAQYAFPYFYWLIDAMKSILGISSPSVIMEAMGRNLMEGMALGIQKGMELPAMQMDMAVKHILEPAMSPLQAGGQINNTTTQNFTMNINTQAKTEPIISDFRMLESLAGGG